MLLWKKVAGKRDELCRAECIKVRTADIYVHYIELASHRAGMIGGRRYQGNKNKTQQLAAALTQRPNALAWKCVCSLFELSTSRRRGHSSDRDKKKI